MHYCKLPYPFLFGHRLLRGIVASFLIVSLLFLPSLRPSHAQETAAGGFEKIAEQWIDAFNKGDAPAIASLYASEAQLVPPDGRYVSGGEIAQYWRQRLSTVPGKLSLIGGQLQASGSLAYQTGVYQLVLSDGLQTKGHILSILCRKADGWKICAQMWNISPETE